MSSRYYFRKEDVTKIITAVEDPIKKKISEAKARGDSITQSIETLRALVINDIVIRLMTEIDQLNAEQVAAENAEKMVNDTAEEDEVKQIVNFIRSNLECENVDFIRVQGRGRNGWTDDETDDIDEIITDLRLCGICSKEICPYVFLYAMTNERGTVSDIRVGHGLLLKVADALEASE